LMCLGSSLAYLAQQWSQRTWCGFIHCLIGLSTS
jgi:hypothetical protein